MTCVIHCIGKSNKPKVTYKDAEWDGRQMKALFEQKQRVSGFEASHTTVKDGSLMHIKLKKFHEIAEVDSKDSFTCSFSSSLRDTKEGGVFSAHQASFSNCLQTQLN